MNYLNYPKKSFKILSSAIAFPEELGSFYSNEELTYKFKNGISQNEKDIFISRAKNHGFENRYRTFISTTSVDLMNSALKSALSNANIGPQDIDFLISVTTTSPKYTTSTAPMVAAGVNLNCPGIELKSGCASSLYALTVASSLLCHTIKNIAIVFGETLSNTVDLDNNLSFAVADGGAAIILSYSNDSNIGLEWGMMGMDGAYHSKIGVGGRLPPNRNDLDTNQYQMTYHKSMNIILKDLWINLGKKSAQELESKKIDEILIHEANNRSRTHFIEGFLDNQFESRSILSQYGNCGPATIIIALHKILEQNEEHKNILLASIGGGVSSGALLIRV